MRKKIKFINSKGDEATFYSKPIILNYINGLDKVESDTTLYRGFNQDGETYKTSAYQKREIVIGFTLIAGTPNDLMRLRKKIMSLFNSKLGLGTLIYEYEGVNRKIECVADGTPSMNLRNNKSHSVGEVTLLAPNPYLNDIEDKRIDVANWEGNFKLPLTVSSPTMPIVMGYKKVNTIVNVINEGDVETGLIIEFKATSEVVNPQLINVNTREYIKLNRTMQPGELITVNTNYGKKRVVSYFNDVETNILNYYDLTSTFLQLDIGDNLFKYDADVGSSNLQVAIYYNPKYLGV